MTSEMKQSICIADGCGRPFKSRRPEGNPFAFAHRYCLACVAKRVKREGVAEPIVSRESDEDSESEQS